MKYIQPYKIFEKYDLAVIGVTTETTPGISSPGPGTNFLNVTETMQKTIDFIRNRKLAKRIVAMTHIGYEEDKELAQNTKGLYLIIGGHSHTPLGNFTGAQGPYPTIEKNLDGEEVFVVTAYRWGEYLGALDISFDEEGRIVKFTGAPIHMTNTTAVDTKLQAQVREWAAPFLELSKEVVGKTDRSPRPIHLPAR
jgi:2',3'-cyclic-nucleotide 2'-phosphodiesterase (5'-nucleotidase family)